MEASCFDGFEDWESSGGMDMAIHRVRMRGWWL